MTDQQPAVLAAPMIRDGYQCMAGRDDCPGHPSATQICVGSARPEQHTDELSALIAEWHATAEDGRSLVEFLGVTEADYAAWVEGRTTGEELLAARRRADLLERMRVSNERARRRAAERRDGAA